MTLCRAATLTTKGSPMLDDTDDLTEIHPLFAGAPSSTEFRKLRKRLVRETRQAIEDYGMVRPGDRWLVCLSGGKDSYTLLAVLHELKWRGLLPVDLLACNLDQGQPNFPATVLPQFLTERGVAHRILETFFMNLFHGGRLAAMPPKLLNEDGDLTVLRPLAYVAEADCERFSRAMNYPIIPCDLCGSQEGLQRMQVKKLLDEWEARSPGRRQVMFRALTNVRPSHLPDPALFDFANLAPSEALAGDVPRLRDQAD